MEGQRELTRKAFKYIAFYVVGLLVAAAVLIIRTDLFGLIIFFTIFLGGLLILVYWHAHSFNFRCQCCGNVFEISTILDLVSPHGLQRENGWKFLCCPKCKKWSKTHIVPKDNVGSIENKS
jgi:hypothetical protein